MYCLRITSCLLLQGLHRVSSAFELKIKAFGPTRDPVDSILEAVSDEAETVVETGGSPVGDAASNSRRLRLIPAALCKLWTLPLAL